MDTNNSFEIKASATMQFALSVSIVLQLREQGIFTTAQASQVFERTADMVAATARDPMKSADERAEILETAQSLRGYLQSTDE